MVFERLNRNLPLYSEADQLRLRGATLGIAGCGVGGGVAQQLGLVGVGCLRLIDGDGVSASNCNRHPIFNMSHCGRDKTDVVAEWLSGLGDVVTDTFPGSSINSRESAERFVEGCDVIVEEVDSFEAKVWLREAARSLGVPVVTGTDLGHGVLIDTERFDLDRRRSVFYGAVTPGMDAATAIKRLFGPYCSDEFEAAIRSRRDAYPQLGTTMAVAGALVARTVIRILLGQSAPSGRRFIDVDALLVGDRS